MRSKATPSSTLKSHSYIKVLTNQSQKFRNYKSLVKQLWQTYFYPAKKKTYILEDDKNTPRISFLIPRGNIVLAKGSELHLYAEASDTEGGIKYVQFFLGNRLLSTKPKAPYELFYTLQEAPGSQPLRAIAHDLAGNTKEVGLQLTIK